MSLSIPSLRSWFRSDAGVEPETLAGAREALFEASFARAAIGMAHVAFDGRILRANATLCALLGYREDELVGIDERALLEPEGHDSFAREFDALKRGAIESYAAERKYVAKSGERVSAWTAARLVGAPPVVLLVIENVQARKAAEAALRESEERFDLAMRGLNEGLYDWRVNENTTYLSPRWKEMLGYAEHEIADEPGSWWELTAPGVRGAIAEQIRRLEAREIDTYEIEIRLRHKDGHWLDVISRGLPVFDERHRVVRLVGTHQDITERKRQEKELRLSSTVFANTHEGILITDFAGRIQTVNPALERLTGYRAEELRGRKASIFKSGRHDESFYRRFFADIAASGRWRGEIWNRRKDGLVQPFWATVSVVRDESGEPNGYVALYSDIGEFKRSQARLDFLVHHDPETSLPNRLSLSRKLEATLENCDRREGGAALLHVELDRFRAIVESLGEPAGDELVTQAARRFAAVLGPHDTLARIGAEEIALVMVDCESDAQARARANALIAAMESPFVFESGATAYCGVLIGAARSRAEADGDTLMRQAKSALQVARDSGDRVRFFEPRHMVEARERLEMETGLRRALEREELDLQFQPLIDLADGRMFGVEALVRWRAPEGLTPPGRFIPLAEKTGLIVRIGEWVLRRACERMKAWLDAGHALGTLSVNVSPRQFERPDICERIAGIVRETGLPFERLEVEITESVLMGQRDAARKIGALRSLGLRVSVDDFGTGHSSLAYLKNFPIHKLKLDRAFIVDVPGDPTGMEIAAAVIRLGHSLDLEVLAEGVETEAQADFLARAGCRFAQGYLFGRPMWEEDLLAELERRARNAA